MNIFKNLLLLPAAMLCLATMAQTPLTKEEKSTALEHLKKTQNELMKSVKGLSEAQLSFKANQQSWSVAETIEHLAISEKNIFGIVQMALQQSPNPALRDSVMSDDQLLGLITSRAQKVKTRPEFEPTNSFGSYSGSLEAFKKQRKSNIEFVKSTRKDLRNRYFDFPFGKVDAYQVLLFMSGHTERHLKQIRKIMTDSSFPKA